MTGSSTDVSRIDDPRAREIYGDPSPECDVVMKGAITSGALDPTSTDDRTHVLDERSRLAASLLSRRMLLSPHQQGEYRLQPDESD